MLTKTAFLLCLGAAHPVLAAVNPADSALFQAIRANDLNQVRRLVQQGAALNARTPEGATPLMHAALYADPACLELLLKKKADPNTANASGATALMWGIYDLRKVRALVAAGANVNARSKTGKTALMLAASYNDSIETVKLLLEKGADPLAKDSDGATALLLAAESGNVEALRLLIDKGGDVNAHAGPSFNEARFGNLTPQIPEESRRGGRGGVTPLMLAAQQNNPEAVELLLAAGADPRANGGRGYTALHGAAVKDNEAVVRALLEKGADPNAVDPEGNTPLIVAAAMDSLSPGMIRALLDKGADPGVKGRDGRTALSWARTKGDTPVLKLLFTGGTADAPAASAAVVRGDAGPVRPAVEKSVALLLSASPQFFDKSGCISCHHQSLPAMAAALARDRGMRVDSSLTQRTLKITAAVMAPHRENLLLAINTIPAATEVSSYALLGMAAEKYPADPLTDAMVHDLAQKQKADGRWHNIDRRPPLGYGDISTTAITLRALQLYPIPGRKQEFQKRIERARGWLLGSEPKTTEDRAYRLFGLAWSKAAKDAIQDAARQLLSEQRPDGGWAQLPRLASDAYATGQVLVALHQAGGVPTTDPAYQRGVKHLLQTQLPDGSWHVKTRAMGFQPYFESGFPHGHDQWISSAGTSWAAMALALSVDAPRTAARY